MACVDVVVWHVWNRMVWHGGVFGWCRKVLDARSRKPRWAGNTGVDGLSGVMWNWQILDGLGCGWTCDRQESAAWSREHHEW